MRFLLTLLILIGIPGLASAAEQWRSERHGCVITFPEGESWNQGTPIPMPEGEMIYVGTHAASKQTIAIVVIDKIPSNRLDNPAVISRIIEAVMALGFSVTSHAPIKVGEENFMQFVGRRAESAAVNLVSVARATMRDNTIIMALTFGRGSEDLSSDKHFLRVIDTFTIAGAPSGGGIAPTTPLVPLYRQAYQIAWSAVGVLLVASIFVVALSRRTHH